MHILQRIKSFLQFVGDPDTFCLVRLAIGNLFRHSEEAKSHWVFRLKRKSC